jgi:hypothetical protein
MYVLLKLEDAEFVLQELQPGAYFIAQTMLW